MYILKYLLNGCFYDYLFSYYVYPRQYRLARYKDLNYTYLPKTFDWIPFETRFELMRLFDNWLAAVMRRENIKRCDHDIGSPFPDERKRRKLFESKLKEAYEAADERRWEVRWLVS